MENNQIELFPDTFKPDFGTDFEFSATEFNMDFEIDLEKDFETRYCKPPTTKDIPDHALKYSNAKKLAIDLEIKKGSRNYVIVDGSFIFGDFIEALLVEKNWRAKEMTISTLSMSQNNIDSLCNLMDSGFVEKLNIIVSDFFYSHNRNTLIRYMYEKLDIDNRFQLAVAGSHIKICIFETENNGFVVIHGSANLRSSANMEQFMVEENEELYKFNKDWQDKVLEKYQTIKKSIRVKKLWQVVTNQDPTEKEKPQEYRPTIKPKQPDGLPK